MLAINDFLMDLEKTFDVVGVVYLNQWTLDFSDRTVLKLFDCLNSYRQDTFQQDQRLVVVTDRNQFNNLFTYRNFLQKLQKIINQVDISNCFVVLLHNDPDNHELIIKDCASVSTDQVPLTFICYNTDIVLEPVPEIKNLLEDSKVFCMMPWTHLMISPSNEIRACCQASEKIGDLNTQSLAESWNSQGMKRLRLSMLNEAYHPTCSKCYEVENVGGGTARKIINSSELSKFLPLVKNTNPDGSVDDFKLRTMDFRFSNLCNLRCRTCNHNSSSKWYKDEKKLNPDYNKPVIMKAGRYELDVWEQILPHIDSIESVYFAGGEPLLMDEHYWLLEELGKRNKFDVKLFYNTNFTAVTQKKRHLFDYWKDFKRITICASLDATGARAEYLRKDTQWNKIVDNITLLKKTLAHIDFKIQCTVSIINCLHVCDFHRESVEQGFITVDEFHTNLVLEPEYQRLDIAPESFKEKIKTKYLNHIHWLIANNANEQTINEFYKLIKFIDQNNNSGCLDAFRTHTTQVDKIRNENLLTVFPELSELFE